VITVVDAAYPFDVCKHDLDRNKNSFEMYKKDPPRIIGIMEERANAYQLMFWDALRTQDILVLISLSLGLKSSRIRMQSGAAKTYRKNGEKKSP
jgi:hypothetical protein